MRKLIGAVSAGAVAALIIALAGSPAAIETVASASAAHSTAAMKKSKQCKKGYVKKHGKCKPRHMRTRMGTGTTTGTPLGKPTAVEVAEGKKLYETSCVSCHGKNGEGSSLAPAYGRELPRSESIVGVVEQLTTPINEKGCQCMTDYSSTYSEGEKEAIGAYITVELTKKETLGGGG